MAIYTPEEIEQFRQRWVGKESLIDELVKILRGNAITADLAEITRRFRKTDQVLTSEGFQSPDRLQTEYGIVADLPALDLRGIDLKGRDCRDIAFIAVHLEGAQLQAARLEKANLSQAHLEYSLLFNANLEGAHLVSALLVGANLGGAKLEKAHIALANLKGANLGHAQLSRANLYGAILGKYETLEPMHNTLFVDNNFLPRWRDHFFERCEFNWKKKALLKFLPLPAFDIKKGMKPNWKNLWDHNFHRWFYTNFQRVRIDDADTVMAADLYRYVKDQQYLFRFKQRHPIIYFFWKLLSDCGGKLSVVGFWSALIVWLFSKIYPAANAIDPSTISTLKSNLPDSWSWLFISFDIFSNLGIRNTIPLHPFGVVLMISESVLGLMMLGMLISVLQNRFARRS